MKIVLGVLIFCFLINCISAFSWFNFRSNQEPKQVTDSSSSHHSTFHSQGSALQQQNKSRNVTDFYRQTSIVSNKNNTNQSLLQRILNQQRYQSHNTTEVHRQVDNINKKSNQTIQQNRSQAITNQQHRFLNNSLAFRQTNRTINNTNNQFIPRRFLVFFLTGKNNKTVGAHSKPNSSWIGKNNTQPFRSRLAFAKTIVTSTKSDLLQALTTTVTNDNSRQNRQRLLADLFYQQQLRAFYERQNERNAARTYFNIDSALKR